MVLLLQKCEKYVLFFLVVLLSTYLLRTVSDPDLWWHIVIGRWIVARGEVPWVDYWNAFAIDKPWCAYSWLFEVICSLIDRSFGICGLQVAQTILGFLLTGVLVGVFVLLAEGALVGAMCGCIAVCVTYPYFFLRPQSISWMLFALLILVGERIRIFGMSWRRLISVALLMTIWANTNITSIFGLAVVSAWVVVLDDGWTGFSKSLRVSAVVFSAGFLGSLLTPYYGHEWLMAGNTFYHPWLYAAIVEFAPLTLYNFQAGMLLLELVLIGFFLHFQPRGIPITQLLMCVGFAILGVCVTKFCPHAVIICSAVIAITWAKNRSNPQSLGNLGVGIRLLENWLSHLSPRATLTVGMLLCASSLVNVISAYREGNMNFDVTPVYSINYIQEHDLPLPVVSTFGNGGYLLYRFSDSSGVPRFRVAIDGRTNVNDEEVARLHSAALGGTAGWDDFISKTQGNTIVWPNHSALVSLLLLSGDWCRVFDDSALVPAVVNKLPQVNVSIGHSVFVRRSYFEANKGQMSSPDC